MEIHFKDTISVFMCYCPDYNLFSFFILFTSLCLRAYKRMKRIWTICISFFHRNIQQIYLPHIQFFTVSKVQLNCFETIVVVIIEIHVKARSFYICMQIELKNVFSHPIKKTNQVENSIIDLNAAHMHNRVRIHIQSG